MFWIFIHKISLWFDIDVT